MCRKKNSPGQSEDVLKILEEHGVKPDARVVNQLLRLCNDPDLRERLVGQLEHLAVADGHKPTAKFKIGDKSYMTTPGRENFPEATNDLPIVLAFACDIQEKTGYRPNLSVLPPEADHLSHLERLESVRLHP